MQAPFIVIPAYGRDYKSVQALIKDLNDGKDFKATAFGNEVYCSIRDFDNFESVIARYDGLKQVVVLKITNGKASV